MTGRFDWKPEKGNEDAKGTRQKNKSRTEEWIDNGTPEAHGENGRSEKLWK